VIARVRAAARGDRGTSLAELLVVMLVVGVVVAATATLTVGFQRTNAQTLVRQDQVDAARTAVERLSKTVRTAVRPTQLADGCSGCAEDAFIAGTGFGLQFYANLDNEDNAVGPSRVTYALVTVAGEGQTLVEKVQRPDSATPPGSGYVYCPAEAAGASTECRDRLAVRTVARGLVTSGASLFRYFDAAGDELLPPASGLRASDLTKIVAIELCLEVRLDGATRVDSTTYIQRVTLPNALAVIPTEERS